MDTTYLACLLSVVLAVCHAAVKHIDMGASATTCGDSMILPREEELHISSKGNAPDGSCSLLLHAMEDSTQTCPYRAFCVAVTSKMMNKCSAKIFLRGTSYNVVGSNSKEISCYSSIFGAWCTQSKSLQISVIEDPKSTGSYGFNFTVFSECRDSTTDEYEPANNGNSKRIDEIEEQINDNRIVGVVVGVTLACMFLVILFISYNYYKNKPTYRQQRDM